MHLLQCKTNFFIRLFFLHSSTQVKEHPFWEASVNIKKNFFFGSLTLVYICLHSSTFVYNRLDSSSDPSTLVYIRLVTCLHSSTFVYTLLDSSSDSSVFLEQICFRKVKQRTITYLITWSYLRRFQSDCGYKSFSISTKFWILPTLLLGLLRGDIFLFGRFENILYN